MGFQCSTQRPWGIHPIVRNDADCPRCGWTAPGPIGDARDDLEAAQQAFAAGAELGWIVFDGGHLSPEDQDTAPVYLHPAGASRLSLPA
jgi:hypothetical protein